MPVRNDREYRSMMMDVRAADNDNEQFIVEGYATTFDDVYTLYNSDRYQVDEQVDARAFDECDMSDTIMQFDHCGRVFARVSNKTLVLTVDKRGLHVRADLGGTDIGRQLYQEIKGGYVSKMSFGYRVSEDKREETYDHDHDKYTVLRTITQIGKVFDVSAVSLPANDQTSISARSFSDGLIAELTEEHRQRDEARKKLAIRTKIYNWR